MLTEQFFPERIQASQCAADRIEAALGRDLAGQDEAAIAVSGGSTPADCFRLLSDSNQPWDRTHIVLTDERWVPSDAADSNERLVRENLIQRAASGARLVPVFAAHSSPAARCEDLNLVYDALPLPFSSCLLGMGEDGHFASLFPDFDELERGLDSENSEYCLPVSTAASPHPRISLTLSALLNSREIVLLFFGEAKRQVYEKAKHGDSEYPISHVLQQQATPVLALWAP